ncbi:ribonuclease P protein component [Mycolicibacterium elephantis]|uniref:Ribonuclease P protein component n=1 Tax=Mycolicibacterium elephantis DSM 44368 TaxID=1335622 RepID=A0A439DNX2_9MYCO|nr:ribonuclease P protein component [Mycolicibacterium elephantis]MCV7221195.1 ribonuclease P protein component [Mycolicibacterium elephantis]RWA16988.1 ribonuclease P [Mycolicibacterium elephantis DSM 44368]
MLPARYRMTRSSDFGATVSRGVRAVQPDLVVHTLRTDSGAEDGPKIGLVVSKSVGTAVQRHRVARRLRHVARAVLDELDPADRVVIRAMPSSRHAISARLEQELRSALKRSRPKSGAVR